MSFEVMMQLYTLSYTSVNTFPLLFLKNDKQYSSGMGLPDRLKEKMEAAGMSQYALAALTGVPQPTIQRILSGVSAEPRRSTLEKISKALLTSPEYLLLGEIGLENYENTTIISNDASDKQKKLINFLSINNVSDSVIDAINSVLKISAVNAPQAAKQIIMENQSLEQAHKFKHMRIKRDISNDRRKDNIPVLFEQRKGGRRRNDQQ